MKRPFLCLIAAAFALAASGCGLSARDAAGAGATVADTAGATAPGTIADRTVLDEQLITGAELAYKAARLAVETLTDAGLIKGQTAARVAALDEQAFAALGVARAAYRAGNAESYRAAVTQAEQAVDGIVSLIRKPGG